MDVDVLRLEILVHRPLTVQGSDGSRDVNCQLEKLFHAHRRAAHPREWNAPEVLAPPRRAAFDRREGDRSEDRSQPWGPLDLVLAPQAQDVSGPVLGARS